MFLRGDWVMAVRTSRTVRLRMLSPLRITGPFAAATWSSGGTTTESGWVRSDFGDFGPTKFCRCEPPVTQYVSAPETARDTSCSVDLNRRTTSHPRPTRRQRVNIETGRPPPHRRFTSPGAMSATAKVRFGCLGINFERSRIGRSGRL